MKENFLTHREILRKFDNHEIALAEIGKNLTHTIKQHIRLENYVDYLERKIVQLEDQQIYCEDDEVYYNE